MKTIDAIILTLLAIPALLWCWEWHLCRKARKRGDLLDQELKAEEERLNRLLGYILNQQQKQRNKS